MVCGRFIATPWKGCDGCEELPSALPGVNKVYLEQYVKMFEWSHNLKRSTMTSSACFWATERPPENGPPKADQQIRDMSRSSITPSHRDTAAPLSAQAKLEPFLPVIHQILEADKKAPKKQRHTAHRIFERLRDEHGYTGGLTVVKAEVASWRLRSAEVFIPLPTPRPGPGRLR